MSWRRVAWTLVCIVAVAAAVSPRLRDMASLKSLEAQTPSMIQTRVGAKGRAHLKGFPERETSEKECENIFGGMCSDDTSDCPSGGGDLLFGSPLMCPKQQQKPQRCCSPHLETVARSNRYCERNLGGVCADRKPANTGKKDARIYVDAGMFACERSPCWIPRPELSIKKNKNWQQPKKGHVYERVVAFTHAANHPWGLYPPTYLDYAQGEGRTWQYLRGGCADDPVFDGHLASRDLVSGDCPIKGVFMIARTDDITIPSNTPEESDYPRAPSLKNKQTTVTNWDDFGDVTEKKVDDMDKTNHLTDKSESTTTGKGKKKVLSMNLVHEKKPVADTSAEFVLPSIPSKDQHDIFGLDPPTMFWRATRGQDEHDRYKTLGKDQGAYFFRLVLPAVGDRRLHLHHRVFFRVIREWSNDDNSIQRHVLACLTEECIKHCSDWPRRYELLNVQDENNGFLFFDDDGTMKVVHKAKLKENRGLEEVTMNLFIEGHVLLFWFDNWDAVIGGISSDSSTYEIAEDRGKSLWEGEQGMDSHKIKEESKQDHQQKFKSKTKSGKNK